MVTIEEIEAAIEKAERLESKLTKDAIDNVGGYTSPYIRHLLNNLGSKATNYLEVGVHRGATFVSTCYKNESLNMRVAVDNFSELNEDDTVAYDFLMNCGKYVGRFNLLNKDCFTIKPIELETQPDLYLYDGNHSKESHTKALTHFYDMLPDEFIFLLDDSNWQQVKEGTALGLALTNLSVLYERHLTDNKWHNGFSISLLKKNHE